MLAIGTLIPPLLDGRLKEMVESSGGNLLIFGYWFPVVVYVLSGWAGLLKDKIISDSDKKKSIGEFSLIKGLLAAILVGITGSAMSLGFEQGIPVARYAENAGIDPLFSTMPVMLLLLSGTMVTTIIWCFWLGFRNRSLKEYIQSNSAPNYFFSILAGLLWFSQFILYGMGKSKMGKYTFTSWGISDGSYNCLCNSLGLIQKGVERCSFKDLYSDDNIADDNYRIFFYDRNKRFNING